MVKQLYSLIIVFGISISSLSAENIPSNFIAYSLEEMIIGDRAGTNGEGLVGSAAGVRIGSEAKVYGSVFANGNVELYDRDTVFGNVTSAANVIKHSGAKVIGTIQQNTQVPVYTIPSRIFSTGTQDIWINNDDSLTISAGNYDTIWVSDRGKLTLNDGVYNAKAFILGNDVKLRLNFPAAGGIEVNASQRLVMGDRLVMSFSSESNPTAVSFYSNGTSEVVLGYNSVAYGTFTAPNAKVIIHDRSEFSGAVYGKWVELQPSIFFASDTIFPQMLLSEPVAGTAINDNTPRIAIWYHDSKSGIDTRTFQVSINGVDRTSEFHAGSDTAWWQIASNSILPDGQITVISFVEDRAGNAIENTATFTVDTEEPVVAITAPANGYITNNENLTITWTVDGVEQSDQTSVTLVEGENTITRTFTDSAGNTGSTTIHVTLDTEPPVVTIISPDDGYLTNETSVTLSWSIDGETQQDETVTLTEEGPNVITRSATDEAGNTGTASITVSRDTEPPSVTIISPEEGYITNQAVISVEWRIDDVNQTEQVSESLSEGENTVTRSATDAAGNTGSATINVTLDTEAPVVAITSPEEGFLTNQPLIAIEWSIDGVIQSEQNSENLIEGTNTISRSATDAAGNTGTATITGELDTEAPVVAITSPADGFLTNNASLTIIWTVDGVEQTDQTSVTLVEGENIITRASADMAGNTGEASITVTLDTQAPVVAIISPEDNFLTNQSPITIDWSIEGVIQTDQISENLTEGSNTITRSATDVAGNTGTATISGILDTEAPVIAITSPADGYLTNNSALTITWSVDGVEQTEQTAVTLTEGENTVTRTSTDAAGNTGIATIHVTLDTQAPAVEISTPEEGFLTNQSPVSIIWSIDGVQQAEQTSEDLVEGANTITRSATDAAGNTGTASVNVTLDTQVPLVTITSPIDNYLTNETIVTISWSIDGVAQPDETVTLTEEGPNVITRSSTDDAGNTGSASITVNRDTQAPVVVISSPENNYLTNQPSVAVEWSIDGVTQTEQTSETLVEGANTITRSATDEAGNIGTAAIQVTLDTEAPVVTISSPEEGFLTTQPSIAVEWSIDGEVQSEQNGENLVEGTNTITRSASDAAGNTGTATVSGTLDTEPPAVAITSPVDGYLTNEPSLTIIWTVDGVEQSEQTGVTLSEGENVITRTSTDAAGNTGTATIHVILDAQAPIVVITSPEDGFLTNNSLLTVKWTVEGVEQSDQTSVTLVEGENIITRTSTDLAGNTGEASITVTLDTQAPVVAISTPEEDFLTNQSPISVIWSIDGVLQTELTSEDLIEGANTISRSTTDAAGNTGIASVNGMLDTQAPVVTITSPVDNYLTNATTVTLSWSIDGVAQPDETITLNEEGANVITRSATDGAGNTGLASVTVNRDTQAPLVVITSPEDGFVTDNSELTIAWTVNGVEQTEQTAVELEEGENTIIRTATDAAGNSGADTIVVTMSLPPPEVIIIRPVPSAQISTNPVYVEWFVDGVRQTVMNSELLIPGINTIVREAQGSNGKTGSAEVEVLFNRNPAIISSPIKKAYSSQTYTYDVQATDPDDDILLYSLTVAPDGMIIDEQSGLISWEHQDNPYGDYNVEIRVRDDNGTEAIQAFVVAYNSNQFPECPYSRNIYFNTTQDGVLLTENFYQYPVLIQLKGCAFPFETVQPNGADIRFSKSDGTPLHFDIDEFNRIERFAALWVRLDTLFAGRDDQYITMYWGNETAESGSRPDSVFSHEAGYRGVWHLRSTETTQCSSATGAAETGQVFGTDRLHPVQSPVGRALTFDGVDDYIEIPSSERIGSSSSFSISAWVNVRNTKSTQWAGIISKGNQGEDPTENHNYSLQVRSYSGLELLEFFIEDNSASNHTCSYSFSSDSMKWYQLTGVYDLQAGSSQFYINGEQVSSSLFSLPPNIQDAPVRIGLNVEPTSSSAYFLEGAIDEVNLIEGSLHPATISFNYHMVTENESFIRNVDNAGPPRILNQPLSQAVRTGENVLLKLRTFEETDETFQWYYNGEELPGANTATYTIASIGTEQFGIYTCRIQNTEGIVYSSSAEITLLEGYDGWKKSLLFNLDKDISNEFTECRVVTSYPLLIRPCSNLTTDVLLEAEPNELRVTDEAGKALPFEVEQWDREKRNIAVWVLLDTLETNNPLHYIRFLWGNTDVPDAQSPGDVFSNVWGAVYHMNGTVADGAKDATGGNDGTFKGNMTDNDRLMALIGSGYRFDGTNDFIEIPHDDAINPVPSYSISAWIKSSGLPDIGGWDCLKRRL